MINLEQDQKKVRKKNTYESVNALYEDRELTLNAFKSGMFPVKATKGEGLKIFTSKQMLQRLPIALAQVKVGNTPGNLLNEMRQMINFLYQEKKLLKMDITI